MNDITGYTFFRSYHDSIKELDLEDRKEMLVAIDDYIFEDQEPDFKGIKKSIWIVMKPNLTTSKNRSNNAKNKLKSKRNQKQIKSKSKTNQNEINDLHDKDMDMNMNMEENIEKEDIILKRNNIYYSEDEEKKLFDYDWLNEG